MLVYGLAVGLPTALISLYLYSLLLKMGLWNPEMDEIPNEEQVFAEADAKADQSLSNPPLSSPPLAISLLPVLAPLIMIASGALNKALKLDQPILAAIGNSTFALFTGLVIAFIVSRFTLSEEQRSSAVSAAFKESGQILLLTGVAGSLSAVVGLTDLGHILSGYFAAHSAAPLLLVWLVACVLHIAIGSVSVSAITAAGLLAPVVATLGVSPVWVALAAGSGSLFLIHVTSNTFWLMQALMGMTLRGTLKTFSLSVSIASVVSLAIILLLSNVM